MKSNVSRKIVFAVLLTVVLAASFTAFTACDNRELTSEQRTTCGLYAVKTDVAGETFLLTVGLSGSEDMKLCDVEEVTRLYKGGYYYYSVTTTFIDGAELTSAVEEFYGKADGWAWEELKITFRVGTYYKSVQSDGEVYKDGKAYYHCFDVMNTQNNEFTLSMRTANSAPWYGTLIGVSVAVAAIAAAAILVARRKKNGAKG